VIYIVFGTIRIWPVSPDTFNELLRVLLIFLLFVLFIGYQRNRMERYRRQLAVTQNRNDTLQYLLNSVSHDLKTPLSIISTSTYLLRANNDDEVQHKRLDRIDFQVEQLNHMVQDILTLSRLESENDERLLRHDLASVTRSEVARIEPKAMAKGLQLETHLPEHNVWIMADTDGIHRIVANLLANAVQYTPVGGTITISLTCDGKIAQVEVRDTGIGIAPEDLADIFQPFYRVEKSRTAAAGNSGLGLALVKKTTDLLNGDITVDSQPGEGSTFSVSFPAAI